MLGRADTLFPGHCWRSRLHLASSALPSGERAAACQKTNPCSVFQFWGLYKCFRFAMRSVSRIQSEKTNCNALMASTYRWSPGFDVPRMSGQVTRPLASFLRLAIVFDVGVRARSSDCPSSSKPSQPFVKLSIEAERGRRSEMEPLASDSSSLNQFGRSDLEPDKD